MVDFKPSIKDYNKVGMKPIVPLKSGYVVSLSLDRVFKNIVNDNNHKDFLAMLIHYSNGIDYDFLFKHIRLGSLSTLEDSAFEHFNEQDVIVEVSDNLRINVELSIDNKKMNVIKNSTTSFKLAGNTYKVGEKQDTERYFEQICIENYPLYDNNLLITEAAIAEVSSGKYQVINNYYREYHINLKNIPDKCYNELSKKERFFKFFTTNKVSELELLSKGDEILKKVLDKLKSLSSDPGLISKLEHDQIEEYARRVAQTQEKEESEKIGFDKGKKIGFDKGEKAKQIEIARNLLNESIDINVISKTRGLSIEEINKVLFVCILLIKKG